MSGPLVIAVPSKGRLQENAEAFFARAGLNLVKPRGAREYRGTIAGLDNVEIAYMSAADITAQLAQGAAHLGITGEDLVREMIPDVEERVVLLDVGSIAMSYCASVRMQVGGRRSNGRSRSVEVRSQMLSPTELR